MAAIPQVLFSGFHPDADGLLERVSRLVDEDMLREIAAADYGWKTEENLPHLKRIRGTGAGATPIGFELREVLELIRWSQPDDPNWRPGGYGLRGHRMRAFACTVLLRAAAASENEMLREGWNQTLIQLIDSLRLLELELDSAAAAFLAWLLSEVD